MTSSNQAPHGRQSDGKPAFHLHDVHHYGKHLHDVRHPSKRVRHAANRHAESVANAQRSESRSKTAIVLGGGAPNMALMAGAMSAFLDRGISFDVVTTSGAGMIVALLWLAPKDKSPGQALRDLVNLSVSDEIYKFLPINFKAFSKPGASADAYRSWLAANPWMEGSRKFLESLEHGALLEDLSTLWWATMCPTGLNYFSWGLCARLPFIEQVVDFSKIKDIKPYFYMNAYNLSKERMEDFTKEEITPDHFRAAAALPLIYGAYEMNGDIYYEGAATEPLNFKGLVELHTGLKTIVVLDVLGCEGLIRAPRDLYDAWILSIMIPLVKAAEDSLKLFALEHNKGYLRDQGAKADLLRVDFHVPDEHIPEVFDWTISNAKRLFDIGYRSAQTFGDEHDEQLHPVETAALPLNDGE